MGIFQDFLILSVYMAFIIGIVFLSRGLLESRISYKSKYTMVRIIVLRMLIPINIGLVVPVTLNKVINTSDNQEAGINFLEIVFCIWVVGFFLSIIYSSLLYIRFYRRVNLYIVDAPLRYKEIFSQECKAMNVKGRINLNMLGGINTPMVVGIFSSGVLIPNKEYGEEDLRLIFRHEIIHYKRKDNLLKLILNIVKSIHWFNPFAYVLQKMFNDYCELSCDEEVVNGSSISEKKIYAMALLNSVKQRGVSEKQVCISEFNKRDVNTIKKRVSSIFTSNTYSKWVTRAILGTCILISMVSFNISHNVYYEVYERVNTGAYSNGVVMEDEDKIITKSFVGIPPESKVLEFNINSIK
ncbi:MAG: M56 family metallopeptidase [Clostridium sp.]